ncbi:MAG: DUF3822 family protein [Lentimicrobiaceae bacterium]|nr:DUF3822 family protein [Lentimicrobiaceae bacterium]
MEQAISVFCYANTDRQSSEHWESAVCVVRLFSSGFCLAVCAEDRAVLSLERYAFVPNLSVEEKIAAIEKACGQQHRACSRAVFQLYTTCNTQIPEAFYVENLNKSIADLLTSRSKEYVPVAEKINGGDMYNLSLWNADLYKKVKETFPNYELKTTIGALLEKVSVREPQAESLVFVEDNNFTILARNAKGLLACNSFAFETEADFLYYCLCFLRKFYPNAELVPLVFCGNITEQSSLFTAVKKYVAKVELMEKSGFDLFVNYHYYCDII